MLFIKPMSIEVDVPKLAIPEPRVVATSTPEEIATEDMKWVNAFYKEHGREPLFDRRNIREYELCIKLQSLRHHKEKFPNLQKLDINGLLNGQSKSPFCKGKARKHLNPQDL